MRPYSPPPLLFNRHLETIYPALFRSVNFKPPVRERIATPDNDFLDLDVYSQGASRCVIISHGLEGNSSRAYVLGMAKTFYTAGFDVIAWNYRGCSGEVNRQLRFYHSGATDDLKTVVEHAAKKYTDLTLVGFSLGGNLTLKYLGEAIPHPAVHQAVTFSVPMNLHSSCMQISTPGNWMYVRRFLSSLKKKVKEKAAIRTDLNIEKLDSIQTLMEFDDYFTGPIHGFQDALDYYNQCSSINFIESIGVRTLIVNALNDPFLGPDCYPTKDFKRSDHVTMEYPSHGGHVGFALFDQKGLYWSEMRALSFIKSE